MRLTGLLLGACAVLDAVLARPPPESTRVLVVVDDTNADVSAAAVTEPLLARGYEVTELGIKEHPKLVEYGERLFDNVVIVPGRTKALGSTLQATDILNFMKLGGNVVTMTTPRYSPASLRNVAAQLGIEVSARGVEYQNNFEGEAPEWTAAFPHPQILTGSALKTEQSEQTSSSAVAKLSANPLVLGLVQAPYTAYAWNRAKEIDEDGQITSGPVTDLFGQGSELFMAAALQSKNNARFVWVGSADLLTDPTSALLITSWAFQERGKLRLAKTAHSDLAGDSHVHYAVEQPLKYCARIDHWAPDVGAWQPYTDIEDVQLEFKMLDPYYRLNLGADGCVEFVAPQQYGMFTFQLEYERPGRSMLVDRKIVTLRHRANDEWDRSWAITNSWVYLSGIFTTLAAFIVFVYLYAMVPEAAPVEEKSRPIKAVETPTEKVPEKVTEKADEKPKAKGRKARA